uniref:CG2146 n=1 Tax=Macrostomum lignano TaxID=282301 RepID=A0A1I8IK40_9PLAT
NELQDCRTSRLPQPGSVSTVSGSGSGSGSGLVSPLRMQHPNKVFVPASPPDPAAGRSGQSESSCSPNSGTELSVGYPGKKSRLTLPSAPSGVRVLAPSSASSKLPTVSAQKAVPAENPPQPAAAGATAADANCSDEDGDAAATTPRQRQRRNTFSLEPPEPPSDADFHDIIVAEAAAVAAAVAEMEGAADSADTGPLAPQLTALNPPSTRASTRASARTCASTCASASNLAKNPYGTAKAADGDAGDAKIDQNVGGSCGVPDCRFVTVAGSKAV